MPSCLCTSASPDLLTVFDGLVLFSMLTHHFTSISKPFAVKTKNVYMLI